MPRRCQTLPFVPGEKRFSFILKNMTAPPVMLAQNMVEGPSCWAELQHDMIVTVPGDDLATSEMDKSGDTLLPNGAGRCSQIGKSEDEEEQDFQQTRPVT